jgi:hypothetical protein
MLSQVSIHKMLAEEKITNECSSPWDELPTDLLEFLVSKLSLVDAIRIFAVCKAWNLASDVLPEAKTWPWLLHQEKSDGTYKLLDPLDGKEYTTKIKLPSSSFPTQMLYCKDGLVVMLDGNRAIFLVNPMTQEVLKLPSLKELDQGSHNITIMSVLHSPNCVVMGIYTDEKYDAVKMYVWHFGEEEWIAVYDGKLPLRIANTSPVPYLGMLFFLGETGSLAYFNLVDEAWVKLDEPEPNELDDDIRGTEDYYLLELGRELVSVCKCNHSDYEVRVFKLDRLDLEWVPVENLAGWTLFLDQKSSFAMPSPHKSWSNKIFFTAIHSGTNQTCVVYCMETKRYEINFSGTRKPLDCVWLQPNLIRNAEWMDEP